MSDNPIPVRRTPFCLHIGIDSARFPHIQIDECSQVYDLTNSATVIGKSVKADVRIEDLGPDKDSVRESICDQHAVIRYDKPKRTLTLTDTSSGEDSRVFVNETRLELGTKLELRLGDTVHVAGYHFKIARGPRAQADENEATDEDATDAYEDETYAEAGTGATQPKPKAASDQGATATAAAAAAGGGGPYVFTPGQEVEVTSYDDGYRGAWFAAVVKALDVRLGVAMVLVEYKDLVAGEDPEEGMLTEWVPVKAEFAAAAEWKRQSSAGKKRKQHIGGDDMDEAEKAAREAGASHRQSV